MKARRIGVSIWELCYFLGIGMWMVATILSSSTFQLGVAWNILVNASMIFAIMSFVLRKRIRLASLRGLFVIALMFFFVLSVYTSYRMLHTFVFMLCAIDLDFDKVLKMHFRVVFITTTVVVIAALAGVIDNIKATRHLMSVRYLGFTSPLTPILFCFAVMSFVAYKKEKIRLSHIVLISVVNIWLFIESRVNAPFFLVFLVLGIALLLKYINSVKRYVISNGVTKIIVHTPIIAFILSVGISLMFTRNNSIMQAINILVNGRWQLQKNAIDTYGLTLFGNNIQWEQSWTLETEYLYVDSAFLKYTLMNGLGFMLIFVIYLTKIMKKICDMNNKHYLFMFILIVVYGIFNPQLLYLEYNPFLLFPVFALADKKITL